MLVRASATNRHTHEMKVMSHVEWGLRGVDIDEPFTTAAARRLRAAALLVFLAGAAGARLVAPDFGLVARDGLGARGLFARGGCALIGAGKGQRSRAAAPSLLQLFGRLLGDDLQVEERGDGERVYAVEHRLEEIEALLLVFDERVFLPIADETYALLQVIEREQVVFPLRVNDVEHDDALVGAHRFRADLRLFLRVLRFQLLPDVRLNFRRGRVVKVNAFRLRVEGEDGLKLYLVVLHVPIFGRCLDRQILLGQIGQQIVRHARVA